MSNEHEGTRILKRTEFQPQQSDIHNILPTRPQSQEEIKVFLFEFMGMALFSYGIVASRGNDYYLALFFFAAVCFAGPFSGAHINPAVTLGMLVSRRINFGLAVLYWLAQFSGAFAGSFLCYLIVNQVGSPNISEDEFKWVMGDLFGEGFATFMFVLFILIQTSDETTLTRNAQPLTNYALVAIALHLSRGLSTHSGGCLNPGMAVSQELFESFQKGDRNLMQHLWVFVVGPLSGGAVASIFYEKAMIYQYLPTLGQILFILVQSSFILGLYSVANVCHRILIDNTIHYIALYFVVPILGILTFWSYYMASLSDPGIVTIKECPKDIRQLTTQFERECKKCSSWKPPRAHHCTRCNKCIFKMDHHCEWINNCVGAKNQKYFILFLIYGLLLCVMFLYLNGISAIIWMTTLKRNVIAQIFTITSGKMVVITTIVLSSFFTFFIAQMLYDQIATLKDNQTVVESHKDEFGRPQSMMFSFTQVFGTTLWLIPTKPTYNLNYAELVYDQGYVNKPENIYLEDQYYDDKAQFYKYFVELQMK